MFHFISIPKFADSVIENNKGQYKRQELIRNLEETLQAKKNGAKCMICGQPISGSASPGPICASPVPPEKRTTAMITKSNKTEQPGT